jgi:methylaspartate mutase sigma subunit
MQQRTALIVSTAGQRRDGTSTVEGDHIMEFCSPAIIRQSADRKAVLSGTASDSHTWNLVFMQLVIEELGYHVANLGSCVADELLLSECVAQSPDLVVISSVNGHGYHDGARAVRVLRASAGLRGTTMVIGGKLGIDGAAGRQSRALLEAGFDAVFGDTAEDLDAFRSLAGAVHSRVTLRPGVAR